MKNGTHFTITYQISAGSEDHAIKKATAICIEQTVEMPVETIPKQASSSLAEILSIEKQKNGQWLAKLSFPHSVIDHDATQLLNVLFGNISLLDGIKIIDADDAFFKPFSGPAFGISGIRNLLNSYHRPLSCTALKPVGLSSEDLARRAYQFARGGIDIIKDDHGLANQSSAPFRERVRLCVDAVKKGEQISGKRTLYFPNITTSAVHILERFQEAAQFGADGVLLSPQLAGIDTIRILSKKNQLPVMAHPAFSGSYILHKNQGFTPEFYYGKLWRAFGADAIIHPNANGRFAFSVETCKKIHQAMKTPIRGFRNSFPVPAGGVHLHSLPHLLERYGRETLFLIGGDLYKHGKGIEMATKEFQNILESYDGQVENH